MAARGTFSLIPNEVLTAEPEYHNVITDSESMKKEYINIATTPTEKFTLNFSALTNAERDTLLDHYNDQYGGFYSFSWASVPSYVCSGADITGRWVKGSLKMTSVSKTYWKCSIVFEKDVVSTSPFDFVPTGASTGGVDISLPAGKTVTIDWGDGNSTKVSGPVDNENYTNAYAGAGTYTVTFWGDYTSVTRLDINTVVADSTTVRIGALSGLSIFYCTDSNKISGDIQNLPTGLTYFYCTGSNTVSGDIQNLPTGLTVFSCTGSNTVSGDIQNLPSGITVFRCEGSNTISGDIQNLPSGLTYFLCYGSNTVSGDIQNLPSGLTYFRCTGSNTISDYTTKTWTTKPATFILVPVGAGGLSEGEVDQLFIDFDTDLAWADGDTITITGTNAAPTGTSAAARTNIDNEGADITIN